MAELDVFVGNYVIIDWELYSLWLSGRSVAEAITVFVRENRSMISDHHVSQDIIVSDFEDNWRLFSMLENCFLMSSENTATAPLQLLDQSTRKRVVGNIMFNFTYVQATQHRTTFVLTKFNFRYRIVPLARLIFLPRNPGPKIEFEAAQRSR